MFSLKKEQHMVLSINALCNMNYNKKRKKTIIRRKIFISLLIFCNNLEKMSDSLRSDDPSKGPVPWGEALGNLGFCIRGLDL